MGGPLGLLSDCRLFGDRSSSTSKSLRASDRGGETAAIREGGIGKETSSLEAFDGLRPFVLPGGDDGRSCVLTDRFDGLRSFMLPAGDDGGSCRLKDAFDGLRAFVLPGGDDGLSCKLPDAFDGLRPFIPPGKGDVGGERFTLSAVEGLRLAGGDNFLDSCLLTPGGNSD